MLLELYHILSYLGNRRLLYLLRSLLVCSQCGRALAGRSYANGTVRYYCPNQSSSRSLAGTLFLPPGGRKRGRTSDLAGHHGALG